VTSHRIRNASSTPDAGDAAPTIVVGPASPSPDDALPTPPARPRSDRRHPIVARVALGLVVVVLVGHLGATLLWSSASNPVRAAVGEENLRGYMVPFFQQSWSVFAPDPVSSDISLDVRAMPAGETTATDWFTVTDRDIANGVTHHLVPSRTYLTNFSLARGYFRAYEALGDDAGPAVGQTLTDGDWRRELAADLVATSDAADGAVRSYVGYEDALNRIASSVAIAQWGEVDDVQVRVRITPVTPFEQRAEPAANPEFRFVTGGWRSPLPDSTLDQGAIDVLYGPGSRS
jgi:hypothetical protein